MAQPGRSSSQLTFTFISASMQTTVQPTPQQQVTLPLVPAAAEAAGLVDRLDNTLHIAKTLFQGRRFKEALMLVDQAVARHPTHVELLHLRGLCLQANGNAPAAFATFMSVLSIDPMHVESLCCVGAMYKSRGMLQEAMLAYQRAVEVRPASQEAASALAALCTDMGSRAKATGCVQEAQAHYQKAIDLCPGYAPAYYHMGVLYSEASMRQLDVALGWYQQAVRCCPTYAEAHCNIGVIHKERGDLESAIASYERALELAPNFTLVKNNLAIALTDLGTRVKLAGRPVEGIALYERALAHNPKYADALYNLGVAHGEMGCMDKAVFMYESAVHFNPACAEAHNNLGVIYKERDNLERAMECYTAALTVKPNFPQSLNNMGVIFTCQGRAQEALTLLTAAIAACPSYAEAYNNLGVLQRDVGAIPQALASYSKCLELAPDSRNAGQNRLLALNYIYDGDEPEVCKAHTEWGKRFASLFKPLPPICRADRDLSLGRPLRVGYISPDLFTHSVSYFAEVPLSHHITPGRYAASKPPTPSNTDVSSHDTHHRAQQRQQQHGDTACSKGGAGQQSCPAGNAQGTAPQANAAALHLVQHVVYCCTPKRDAKTARLQANVQAAHGVWREVTQLSEQDLAKLVREDEIDILVELTGHTANNRLGTMAMRPAPIQVTWIGYPNSTGLKEVDYRITDVLCDPLKTHQTYVEELIRLPGDTFLCYTPAHDAPAVAPAPALANGYITFGSFNNLAKVTPKVLALWARILREVPYSRLVLKNKPFACDTARMHVLNLLAAEGIESWRVDLLPLAAANSDHLSTYSLMDISLDTFPYAGTTTTCESMFMGVPCLTLAGRGHAHNVGVSLVTSVGLQDEWVARTPDEYVALAVRHAADISALSTLRHGLRDRMLASRLCNAPVFINNLEQTYHSLWERYVVAQVQEGHGEGLVMEEPQQQETVASSCKEATSSRPGGSAALTCPAADNAVTSPRSADISAGATNNKNKVPAAVGAQQQGGSLGRETGGVGSPEGRGQTPGSTGSSNTTVPHIGSKRGCEGLREEGPGSGSSRSAAPGSESGNMATPKGVTSDACCVEGNQSCHKQQQGGPGSMAASRPCSPGTPVMPTSPDSSSPPNTP